jgi:outer membrane immunogenic protein
MRGILVGAAFIGLLNVPALAADPTVIPADSVDPARFGWDGAYLGLSVGYAWLSDVDESFDPPLHDQGEDWVVGGHAGYLVQFGGIVVGAEAEATRLDIQYENFNFITVENAFSVKARAGYAVERFLVSGHAGGVYATTNFLGLKDWGWTAGAGLDYAFTDNITFGAQYTHFGFEDFDGTLIDAKVDTVTARFGYKF